MSSQHNPQDYPCPVQGKVMMEKLIELAERCEKATGPSTKLDEMIVVALSGQDPMDFDGPWDAPAYTASLDDALTLVPEGWVLTLTIYHDCSTARLEDDRVNPVRLPAVEVDADTAALALCAAALRARALSDARDGQGEG